MKPVCYVNVRRFLLCAYVLFLALLNPFIVRSQNDTIRMSILGKTYSQLDLEMKQEHGIPNLIKGQSVNGIDWMFCYPSASYDSLELMRLVPPSRNDTSFFVAIRIIDQKDTISTVQFLLERGNVSFKATFDNTKESKTRAFNRQAKALFIDNLILDTAYTNHDRQLLSSAIMLQTTYSMFGRGADTSSYEQLLQKYIKQTKRFPNSSFGMRRVATTLSFYNSKDDVKKVYDCFSEANRKSYYGEKIEGYLNNNYFENSLLRECKTNKEEPIIMNPGKFNLVVFSASWCTPCHKLLPLIRKLYEQLSGKMDIVYVSIDEPPTVEAWKAWILKENVPWRSLLAVNSVNKVKDKYFVQTIPYVLFVYPGGKMTIVDLREEKDQKLIYSTVNK